jgi:hypothetical protein
MEYLKKTFSLAYGSKKYRDNFEESFPKSDNGVTTADPTNDTRSNNMACGGGKGGSKGGKGGKGGKCGKGGKGK